MINKIEIINNITNNTQGGGINYGEITNSGTVNFAVQNKITIEELTEEFQSSIQISPKS